MLEPGGEVEAQHTTTEYTACTGGSKVSEMFKGASHVGSHSHDAQDSPLVEGCIRSSKLPVL